MANHQLSCEQVVALLNFYVEEKLSSKLSEYVKEHLQNCPSCMNKYLQLKNMLNKYVKIDNNEIENQYITKQYEDFKLNLSAYIDNELNDFENIKIKKIAISNPLARQDLENIYTFKKMLLSSYEKTKNDLKSDFSKNIIFQIHQNNPEEKHFDPFIKLSIIFSIMITGIITGIVVLLYL